MVVNSLIFFQTDQARYLFSSSDKLPLFFFFIFSEALRTGGMAHIMNLSLLVIGTLLQAISTRGADVGASASDNRKCSDCTNCCNNNGCVSGDMHVEEQSRGIIRVSQLSNGDFIRGISGADRKPGCVSLVIR